MRVIAFYLPQYYSFPENDKWWGKGFTEWTNVKKSKPLYKGHYQPTVPLNENYYCLENKEVFEWQIELAKKYGIYGFCFYHYWMGEGRQLMQKPVEMYLQNKDLDFPFCISWANHNWARTWTGGDQDILMDVRYGDESEWERHFQYLLEYFQDKRYIKYDDKPVLVIYQPERIDRLHDMLAYLDNRAKEEGLDGITFISQAQTYVLGKHGNNDDLIKYSILYEPDFTKSEFIMKNKAAVLFESLFDSPRFAVNMLCQEIKKVLHKYIFKNNEKLGLTVYDYDGLWKRILNRKIDDSRYVPGAFVTYDTSPRKGYRGIVTKGFTIDKFKGYFTQLLRKTEKEFKKDIVFMMAWNEWGEGAYLEPDERNGYAVLESIKEALDTYKG